MLVDIAAIPVDTVIETALRLSKELALLAKGDIELGGDKLPHVSLLMIDVEENSMEILRDVVVSSFKTWPNDLAYGPLSQEKKSLRVFWNAIGIGWLRLHHEALEIGERHHSRVSEECWMAKAHRFDEVQIHYVRKYGSPYVREYFAPHISLARFPTEVDLSTILAPEGYSGVNRIGLFEMDSKYQTIREI